MRGTLTASFDKSAVAKTVSLSPGKSDSQAQPRGISQLTVQHPRLWWPNGYGKPELYTLKIYFLRSGKESDAKDFRFGIREITYETQLARQHRPSAPPRILADRGATKKMSRWWTSPTRACANIPATDPYPSIFPPEWKEGWKSWVASLEPGAERSAAVKSRGRHAGLSPYLVIQA